MVRTLMGLLGMVGVGACADESDPSGPIAARDQLATAETFTVVTGQSTAVLAMTLVTPRDSYTRWVSVPISSGSMVAATRDDLLSVEDFELALEDLELLSFSTGADEEDDDEISLTLEGMSIRMLAPASCRAGWSSNGETGSCGSSTVLHLEWAIGIGDQRIELDPLLIGPLELSMVVDHVGDELQLDTWGVVAGVDWSVGWFSATATLAFDVQGITAAASVAP